MSDSKLRLNKNEIVIFLLVILLIVAIGYIVFDKLQENKARREIEIYQQGAQYGYQSAVIQIMQQATSCQQVPLYAENMTINLIAVECLQTQSNS